MVEFRHILCPIDLSESSVRTLAHAASLARRYGARLTVLHVVPTFEPMQVHPGDIGDPVRIVYPMPREDVLDEMRGVVDMAGVEAAGATLVAEAGDEPSTIVDQAVATSADLVVMGTHGRRGFKRVLLGSVAETVLREAPCPVLTIPPHASATTADQVSFKAVLCPMDFSPAAMQAMGFAMDLARQVDGTVTLLHVIEWLAEEEPRSLVHFNVPEYRRHLTAEAEERLRLLIADASRTGNHVESLVVIGRAHREILQAAAAKSANLIVMGAQGRGGVELTLFGSTTQQVVRGAECPVLTVRGVSIQV